MSYNYKYLSYLAGVSKDEWEKDYGGKKEKDGGLGLDMSYIQVHGVENISQYSNSLGFTDVNGNRMKRIIHDPISALKPKKKKKKKNKE